MKRKEIILFFRTNRLLKGHKPAVVYLKQNRGNIYNEGQADFIFSISKDRLHFQRLSFFTKRPLPEKDFSFERENIKSMNVREVNVVTNCLTIYTFKRNFIEIYYNTKSPDTYETEDHIASIVKLLKEQGVKESKL